MTWFSWHEPLITPAQGIYTFLGFLALYVLIRFGMWFFAEPSAEIDTFAEPHGEVVNAPRRSV